MKAVTCIQSIDSVVGRQNGGDVVDGLASPHDVICIRILLNLSSSVSSVVCSSVCAISCCWWRKAKVHRPLLYLGVFFVRLLLPIRMILIFTWKPPLVLLHPRSWTLTLLLILGPGLIRPCRCPKNLKATTTTAMLLKNCKFHLNFSVAVLDLQLINNNVFSVQRNSYYIYIYILWI
jgi:hypothetical protein